jgi:hypothetical protein
LQVGDRERLVRQGLGARPFGETVDRLAQCHDVDSVQIGDHPDATVDHA